MEFFSNNDNWGRSNDRRAQETETKKELGTPRLVLRGGFLRAVLKVAMESESLMDVLVMSSIVWRRCCPRRAVWCRGLATAESAELEGRRALDGVLGEAVQTEYCLRVSSLWRWRCCFLASGTEAHDLYWTLYRWPVALSVQSGRPVSTVQRLRDHNTK